MHRIVLTGRQRDFLASYPNESNVAVAVDFEMGVDGDNPYTVQVFELSGGVDEGIKEIELPPEGFLGQPIVRLHDPEASLDHIPTALWTPEQLEDRREENLELLPHGVSEAFWLLRYACDNEGLAVDFDAVLDQLRAGLAIREEGEKDAGDDDAGASGSE